MSEDERFNRRRFFREGLRQLLGHAEKAAAPVERFAKEFAKLDQSSPPSPAPPAPPTARDITLPLILRPPGVYSEKDFLEACSRCGECVKACPVQCISIEPEIGGGAPHIIAERKPCVVCDELACMHVCPTGALQVIPRVMINMGKAVWGEGKCVRPEGEDCRKCVEVCPMGTAAIDIGPDGGIEVKEACIGCGQCQHVCPTTPRAIVVVPTRN